MASFPRKYMKPPSADFVETRMPDYHDAFGHSLARYDPAVHRYEVDEEALAIMEARDAGRASWSDHDRPSALKKVPSLPPALLATKFLDGIFSQAMSKLKNSPDDPEPKGRAESGYGIRTGTMSTWADVYKQLERAREQYDGTKQGLSGRIKRGSRKIMERGDGVRRIVKAIPEVDIASPVFAVANVLLEACKTSSEVRTKVSASFHEEDLDGLFANVETLLAVFPEDQKIIDASVELIMTLLKATEAVIGFYLKHRLHRGFLVVMQGDSYQATLVDCLAQIQNDSQHLLHQATLSNMAGTKAALKLIMDDQREIKGLQQSTIDGEVFVMRRLNIVAQQQVDLYNVMVKLLDEGEERKRHQEVEQRARADAAITFLGLAEENAQLRHELFTGREQAQVTDWFTQSQPLLVLPTPSRVYTPVYQDPPSGGVPYSSSLPRPEYLPFMHLADTNPQFELSTLKPEDILRILNCPKSDQEDIFEVLDSEHQVPVAGRNRAKQIVTADQFREWILTPDSANQLYIQGDFKSEATSYVSALSLFCATFTQALGTKDRYLPLVFFCGCHVEEYGVDMGQNLIGALAMITSLTSQVLRQCMSRFPTWTPDCGLAGAGCLEGAKRGDIQQFCRLFGWLVGSLPHDTTVICLIDGVGYFETEELEEDAVFVMDYILKLSRGEIEQGRNDRPAVKIMATNPLNTHRVRDLFANSEDDDWDDSSILDMAGMPVVSYETSLLQFESQVEDSALEGDAGC